MRQQSIDPEERLPFNFDDHPHVEIKNGGPDDVDVFIEYNPGTNGAQHWVSAIKADNANKVSQTIHLEAGASCIVSKLDLVTTHAEIRVSGNQNGVSVVYD
ncbi:hypothetical protein WI72_21815 [Burkholderia ubonensis]|uniref:hypothetical protein n=1 Tax=Burkholderia ubonensis TaxID=101571 RepID=UPI00075AAF4C|nr:hypothetical protein [Burkholderia ubonensis]KVC53267.1 hypothetical protein WI72_21815 [Burkholderia ubonensis]